MFWLSRRPKPAEKPRKACPGPLPGAQSLAGNSPGLLRACSGPPLACRGAPQRQPRVASGHPKPARELARTWPGLPQAAPVLPRSSGRPSQGRPWIAEQLRRPRAVRELQAWTARPCHETAAAILRSAQRPQTMPKKRPNMLESTLDVQAQCFVPWRRREAELDNALNEIFNIVF